MSERHDDTPAHDFDQHGFDAVVEWGQAGVRLLAPSADLAVIVDVLSFTTAVTVAVERGAVVYPYRFRDASAADRAREVGAILAGPRSFGGPSLSPESLVGLRAGDRLLLPSPNGATCAVLAAEAGATVAAGCLRNASAVGTFIDRLVAGRAGGRVALIPAGEQWPDGGLRPAIEDLLGVGAILSALSARARFSLSPEARVAMAAFEALRDDLGAVLRDAASGRELIGAGYPRDVELAAELDASGVVPVLADGAFAAA